MKSLYSLMVALSTFTFAQSQDSPVNYYELAAPSKYIVDAPSIIIHKTDEGEYLVADIDLDDQMDVVAYQVKDTFQMIPYTQIKFLAFRKDSPYDKFHRTMTNKGSPYYKNYMEAFHEEPSKQLPIQYVPEHFIQATKMYGLDQN